MIINTRLTAKQCWEMVNRIQEGRTPEEIRRRCDIAEAWINANETVSVDEWDELMDAVANLYRWANKL